MEEIKNSGILGFEDVKNSEIDIFGNKFEMNFSEEYIRRLKDLNINKINEEDTFKQLKELLNLILNDEKAYEKISDAYIKHEKREFGTQVFIKVLTFIFNEYSKEIAKIKGIDFGVRRNREQKRNNNYNRGYNNRGYSRRY